MEKTGSGLKFAFMRRKSGDGLSLSYPIERCTRLDDLQQWVPGDFPMTDFGDYEDLRIPVMPGAGAEFFRVKLPEIPE